MNQESRRLLGAKSVVLAIAIKENAFRKAISTANETVKAEFRLRHRDGSYRDIEAVYVNMLANPRIGGIVAN